MLYHKEWRTIIFSSHQLSMIFIQYIIDPTTTRKAYQILQCGTNAQTVFGILSDLMTTLQTMRADIGSRRASLAFVTFKSIANSNYVLDVLQNITTAAPVPDAITNEDQTPPMICVDGLGQLDLDLPYGKNRGLQDPYTMCTETDFEQIHVKRPDNFQIQFHPFFVLCPNFFKLPTTPSLSKSKCLDIDPHFNRSVEDGARLDSYQMWTLFFRLSQAHIKDPTDDPIDADDCWRLSASEAVKGSIMDLLCC